MFHVIVDVDWFVKYVIENKDGTVIRIDVNVKE